MTLFSLHFSPFWACFTLSETFQYIVQNGKHDSSALQDLSNKKKKPKDLSKISGLDFILFVIFYEQITKYTSFTNSKYLQFLYNKALLRFWFMAFLEHSVFQNKDIGVVFRTLFIYTLDMKWELFRRGVCTLFWSDLLGKLRQDEFKMWGEGLCRCVAVPCHDLKPSYYTRCC